MNSYANWVKSLQSKAEPHDNDIRVEVKYNIPGGDV